MLRSAGGASGSYDEVRPTQGVEVQRVVCDEEGRVEQLAQLFGGGRRLNVVDRVAGLHAGHVVGFGADAADAGGDARHFLHRTAHAELLEAAQLGNLEVAVGHLAVVVEEDRDLAVPFQPGDGI